MMSTTHAAMGLAGACLLVPVSPTLAGVAAIGAIAGGVFPDLDLAFEHRKTLHHPELFSLLSVIAIGYALYNPALVPVGVAAFLLSAALHSITDVFGGGLGLRPWKDDDRRGIYLHSQGRWVPPKRWVRYDGAPEDLAVTVAFSVPPFLLFGATIRRVILVGLAVSVVYVLLRKRLVDVYESMVEGRLAE